MKIRTINDFIPTGLAGTPAAEAITRATAHIRHTDRVEATREAARRWASLHPLVTAGEYDLGIAMAAAFIADKFGYGNGTTRHEAFRGLGKGRKQATDGSAYRAAADVVLSEFGVIVFGRFANCEPAIWFSNPQNNDFIRCFRDSCPWKGDLDWFPRVGLDGWTFAKLCPAEARFVATDIIRSACGDPRALKNWTTTPEIAGAFYNEVCASRRRLKPTKQRREK